MSTTMTPREIVRELDKYIVGQNDAKRMVAIAVRNRWRRQKLDPSLRDEVSPKNIIMMGPTGVGKTEIARRLAKLCGSPFIKVEATKYTEVGYVGRDVESMVRDLMEIGVAQVREEEREKVRAKAEAAAQERLLDLLLPGSGTKADYKYDAGPTPIPLPESPTRNDGTREKLRAMWLAGRMEESEVEMDVEVPSGPQVEMMSMPGMEQMGSQLKDAFSRMFPSKKKSRKMKVPEAYALLVQEESERLIDHDAVTKLALERVEQTGIIFIDEIDKVAIPAQGGRGGVDVSREGVQRDLLPIVEGSVVNTKYGMVRTDHVLFIAAGAFHVSKPADLIPELQGRFPLRVELSALGKEEFLRILKEPHNALTLQYAALMQTEGVTIEFSEDALEEVAAFAEETNRQTENIGARRLYTIMEKILSDLSFEAPERIGETVRIDREWVREKLEDVRENADMTRFILLRVRIHLSPRRPDDIDTVKEFQRPQVVMGLLRVGGGPGKRIRGLFPHRLIRRRPVAGEPEGCLFQRPRGKGPCVGIIVFPKGHGKVRHRGQGFGRIALGQSAYSPVDSPPQGAVIDIVIIFAGLIAVGDENSRVFISQDGTVG